jgi:hypothetical protein
MLLQEARSDIISYEVDYDDVEWDEEEVEGDEF